MTLKSDAETAGTSQFANKRTGFLMDKDTPNQKNFNLKESYPHEKRNLIVFGLNQILMRLGWMFKSESVVIPRVC